MKLVTVFCFLLVATIVAAQDTIDGCRDKLADDLSGNPYAVCQHFEDYSTCIIRVTNLEKIDMVEDALQRLDSEITEKQEEGGYDCNIDITELFMEVKFMDTADDIAQSCGDILDHDVSDNSNAICQDVEVYIKCLIRGTGLVNIHKDGVEDAVVESLENEANEKLREGGYNCNIDISELFEEVKAENAGSTTSPIGWLVVMVTSFLVMLQQR